MKSKTQKMVTSAMLAALVCILTFFVRIPSPFKGYINLGDCIVLFAGWYMSPLYAFCAAAVGSALADLFAGYALYIPATFVIKGLVALVACLLFKRLSTRSKKQVALAVSGIVAELVMVIGYFVFEGALYGFGASAVNIPLNAFQGVAGVIVGALLFQTYTRDKK